MKNRGLLDWLPAAFAFLLSGMEFYQSYSLGKPMTQLIAFVAFIPMCFFYLGSALMHYRKRIEALEAQVTALESRCDSSN